MNECKPLLGGALCDGDGVAGASPIGRGFACFGVGGRGGGGGGGGGGWGGSPSATRALSSSSGDGGGGSSSLNDKLRAARERRGSPRGEEVGGRAVGGAARGGRGGGGADPRGGGRGGGGGRGRGGAGGGRGPSPEALLNGLISREKDPERLLRLVGDELTNFDAVNVATAFRIFGTLCDFRSFPRNIAADDSFRGLMARARAMCVDGRLRARELAYITHAVTKMSAAGKLAAADAGVLDMLAALEQRVVLIASDMDPQAVSNTVYAFAVAGRNRITLNLHAVSSGNASDSNNVSVSRPMC